MRPVLTTLKTVLRHDRAIVAVGLLGAVVVMWVWLVPTSLDMYGRMDGLAAWMMQDHWDVRYGVLIFLMWTAMMVGMMLPSAMPAILLFSNVVGTARQADGAILKTFVFSGGYLLTWTAFSLLATLLQWGLAEMRLLSPMMEAGNPVFAGLILMAAGAYQWAPLKRVCLTQCRSPLDYVTQHWRPGVVGALRMGVGHGLFCVGCCWVLMLLLFAGGVMSLAVIGAITLLVLLEKLAPFGHLSSRLTGVAMVGLGLWVLLS